MAEALTGPFRRIHDAVAPAGMPAHVTLLWPFIVSDLLDDGTIAALREFLARQPAFGFHLANLAEFPGVLYLAPQPAEPFIALTRALWSRYPDNPPFAGLHENIIPHLTIAHTEDPKLLAMIRQEVEEELAMCGAIHCRAEAVTLMAERDGLWSRRDLFPLKNSETMPS